MVRSAGAAALVLCCTLWARPLSAQPPAVQDVVVVVRDVVVKGAQELPTETVLDAAQVNRDRPLPVALDHVGDLADRVLHRYKDEGYTFATVSASFDEGSGVLLFTIDEGVIDRVEFTGVDDRLKRMFAEQFAIQAGDVFNRKRARQALDVLLEQTRGAVRPGHLFKSGASFYDSRQVSTRSPQGGTFDLIDKNGERVLFVGLYESAGRFRLVPDLGEREDWFTSVDGFVPSIGFGAAVFDHQSFNHAYVAGHLSYRTASQTGGYTLGFERPFFATRQLYVGGEFHDLTVSDDTWQVSSLEASLSALGPRRSIRDYYRREGVQISGAFRPKPFVEVLGAWRYEHHHALGVESDFSFWNSDDPFRPNRPALDGHLTSLLVGASLDGQGFARESLDASYRRHQLDSLFGDRLPERERSRDMSPVWRLDWTTEISAPDAFGSDFDFTRSIFNARVRKALSPHQDFAARFIRGWTTGTPPPQRLFAIGGMGSVHGYEFKTVSGDAMEVVNLEYLLGWRNGIHVLGFYDAGHVPSTPWLKGIGWGIGIGDVRIEFGYPTSDIHRSPEIFLRFGHSF